MIPIAPHVGIYLIRHGPKGHAQVMMKSGLVFLISLVTGISTLAQDAGSTATNSLPLKKIAAIEATNHFSERVIVMGKVAGVSVRRSLVLINIDKPYPKSPLTAVIFSKFTNGFGDLEALAGKTVEINGVVTNYHGKPEIILEKTNQLTVLETPTVKTNN